MKRIGLAASAVLAAACACAQTVVNVTGVGADKKHFSVSVDGAGADAYVRTLRRNLELTGCFAVGMPAAVKITGTVGGTVTAEGAGKRLTAALPAGDAKSLRMEARRMSNAICEAITGQKGFATDQIAFVSRKGPSNSELCVCYPDGQDVRMVTSDGKAAVGPRWKDADTLFYTGFLNGGPQIWELNTATGARTPRWNFKGLSTGATVSPDGKQAAVILSFQGNPELYVIDLVAGRWRRLTNTPAASEGQPSWSPDGGKIVYVSDETRHPQLYVIDVATKEKRRITSRGSQNVDPDWGADGLVAYITKQGGQSRVAVMDPRGTDASARPVTAPGSWEHPSWARDGRHIVAGRDKALFVVDTREEGGDEPRQVFKASGNWITPSWMR
ncbi:MAG: PD40 domain-containing protein [Kiritimatiellae bacterium]|nr:PD40 domain-containing protein [Kiritimatiellia bacterium]